LDQFVRGDGRDLSRSGIDHRVDVTEPTAHPSQQLRVLALIVSNSRDGKDLTAVVAMEDSGEIRGVPTCHRHTVARAQQLAGKPVAGI
jgi:hypothetical protein